jgi:succinate dehydrogenase / fumarate reductase cytochrome b subunit
MSSIFNSSLGKKLIMSISGLFLMLFLLVHLGTNLLLLVGDGELYNKAAHALATIPLLRIVEYLLAFGFFFHILYATVLTLKNRKARPIGYAITSSNEITSWSSRNMYILGLTIFVFLVLHLINFFLKLKLGGKLGIEEVMLVEGTQMHNTYDLVSHFFMNYWWYNIIYIVSAILLGLHLSHGFWSAFQTVGLSNSIWIKRLEVGSYIYAVIIAVGFTIIPIYFFIKSLS